MSYREGAEKFYDLFGAKDDASFYIDLAHEHGDKALELGVGTARLAIQLARVGIETWGIDNSQHMLKAAKTNLDNEPQEVRNRVHLELADVRGFDLNEDFGLVYFPSYSFDHILERDDQIKALKAIRKHIALGGVYAFDLVHVPEPKDVSDWFVQKKLLDGDRMVVRTGYNVTKPEERIMTVNLWYELYKDGRMLERHFDGSDVYVHSPEGIRELLEETGFEIVAWYGDHDKRSIIPESKMMVIVTRPI
jgi:ubiquinone/menaquinone biosynthesis C-methylase UbiE